MEYAVSQCLCTDQAAQFQAVDKAAVGMAANLLFSGLSAFRGGPGVVRDFRSGCLRASRTAW